jgi:hypothetical protein
MYGNFTQRELDAFWIGVETEQDRLMYSLEKLLKSRETHYSSLSDKDLNITVFELKTLIKGEK